MKARFLLFLDGIRSAYWFLPSLMLLGSVLLALGLVLLDQRIPSSKLSGVWWMFTGGAEGARSLLSTVAGSVIGVAGTTFSITIAVLSLTSSQFGPRLLRGFLRDTGNQAVLGTFVGTFLYCLLVLRMVRSIEEVAFVPHIATTGGVVLAITSVAMLIYFIHHISTSIQASQIIAKASHELMEAIDNLFPEEVQGTPPGPPEGLPTPAESEDGIQILARRSGYIQAVDGDALFALAMQTNSILTLRLRPGAFIARDNVLAEFRLLKGFQKEKEQEEIDWRVNNAYSVGDQRTATQDMEFLMLQLVEVAVRALSPGINDPFTARMCLDRLGEATAQLVQRVFPTEDRADDSGRIRVSATMLQFADIAELAFGEIRHYGASDPVVAARLLTVIGEVAECAPMGERRETLIEQLRITRLAALSAAKEAIYKFQIEEQFREVMQRLHAPVE